MFFKKPENLLNTSIIKVKFFQNFLTYCYIRRNEVAHNTQMVQLGDNTEHQSWIQSPQKIIERRCNLEDNCSYQTHLTSFKWDTFYISSKGDT